MSMQILSVAAMVAVLSVCWIPTAFVASVWVVCENRQERRVEYRRLANECLLVVLVGWVFTFVIAMSIFMQAACDAQKG